MFVPDGTNSSLMIRPSRPVMGYVSGTTVSLLQMRGCCAMGGCLRPRQGWTATRRRERLDGAPAKRLADDRVHERERFKLVEVQVFTELLAGSHDLCAETFLILWMLDETVYDAAERARGGAERGCDERAGVTRHRPSECVCVDDSSLLDLAFHLVLRQLLLRVCGLVCLFCLNVSLVTCLWG